MDVIYTFLTLFFNMSSKSQQIKTLTKQNKKLQAHIEDLTNKVNQLTTKTQRLQDELDHSDHSSSSSDDDSSSNSSRSSSSSDSSQEDKIIFIKCQLCGLKFKGKRGLSQHQRYCKE